MDRWGKEGDETTGVCIAMFGVIDTSVASDESVRVRVSVGRQSVCLVRATVELFPTR